MRAHNFTYLSVDARRGKLVLEYHREYAEECHHECIVADAFSLLKQRFAATQAVTN